MQRIRRLAWSEIPITDDAPDCSTTSSMIGTVLLEEELFEESVEESVCRGLPLSIINPEVSPGS